MCWPARPLCLWVTVPDCDGAHWPRTDRGACSRAGSAGSDAAVVGPGRGRFRPTGRRCGRRRLPGGVPRASGPWGQRDARPGGDSGHSGRRCGRGDQRTRRRPRGGCGARLRQSDRPHDCHQPPRAGGEPGAVGLRRVHPGYRRDGRGHADDLRPPQSARSPTRCSWASVLRAGQRRQRVGRRLVREAGPSPRAGHRVHPGGRLVGRRHRPHAGGTTS